MFSVYRRKFTKSSYCSSMNMFTSITTCCMCTVYTHYSNYQHNYFWFISTVCFRPSRAYTRQYTCLRAWLPWIPGSVGWVGTPPSTHPSPSNPTHPPPHPYPLTQESPLKLRNWFTGATQSYSCIEQKQEKKNTLFPVVGISTPPPANIGKVFTCFMRRERLRVREKKLPVYM